MSPTKSQLGCKSSMQVTPARRSRQTGECTANGVEGKPCVLVQGGASSSQQEVTAISCVGTVTGNGETMSSGQSDTLILSCWSR